MKQGPVPYAIGNNQVASFIGSLAVWILVSKLKQGAAHAGTYVHLQRTGCCVEMVLVLCIFILHGGVHQVIWQGWP